MPKHGVLSMHCSANIGTGGRHGALLRPVGHRQDDAVGRSRARAHRRRRTRLVARAASSTTKAAATPRSSTSRPSRSRTSIATTQMFGTILENVVLDPVTRRVQVRRISRSPRTRARRIRCTTSANHVPSRARRTSEEHRVPDGGCVRRAAADREADARAGDVLLHVGLHGEGRRHGARRDRAAGDVQRPASARCSSSGIRRSTPRCSGKLIDEHGSRRVAGEHRLERRAVRRRQAHEAAPHARDGARGARPASCDSVPTRDRSDLRAWRCRPRCTGVPDEVLNPRNTWKDAARVRRAGEEAGRDVPEELREVRERGSAIRRRQDRTGRSTDGDADPRIGRMRESATDL